MTADEAKLEIINRALLAIGSPTVDDLTSTEESFKKGLFQYDASRRTMLREHEWNFCVARVEITKDGTDPEFDFEARYALPSDFIRLSSIFISSLSTYSFEYQIESGFILSNISDDLPLVYIKDNNDASTYDELFREALSLHIASRLAYSVVQTRGLREDLNNHYELARQRAKFVDSSERSMQRVQADEWINARLGFSFPNRFHRIVPPTP